MSCGSIMYPVHFPCPTWDYSQSMNPHQRRTQFDSGWTRQRQRHEGFTTANELSFVMPSDVFDNWATWMKNNGYTWFTIHLDRFAGELQPTQIRLTGGYSWDYADYDQIAVTVPGELRYG